MPPPTPAVGRVARFFREARLGTSLPQRGHARLTIDALPISYRFPLGLVQQLASNAFVKATSVFKHVKHINVKSCPQSDSHITKVVCTYALRRLGEPLPQALDVVRRHANPRPKRPRMPTILRGGAYQGSIKRLAALLRAEPAKRICKYKNPDSA